MIKAGLLGVGTIGCTHLSAYKHSKENNGPVRLEACFDLVDQNFQYVDEDVRKYMNLDEFFENEAGKLDLVDICLPTFLHKEIAVKAMNYGFHVLCEKPMALNYEEASEICKVSEQTGKKLMIAHCLRFAEDYEIVREYIDKKILGKLKTVKFSQYGAGLPNGQNNWFKDNKKSGGPILDVNIHNIDWLVYLLGKPKSLSAVSLPNNYDCVSATILFEDNIPLNLNFDFTVPCNKHSRGRCYRFDFENGYIYRNLDEESIYVAVDRDGNETDLNPSKVEGIKCYINEIQYFAECITNEKQPQKCLPVDSALAVKIIDAIKESADKGGEKIEF